MKITALQKDSEHFHIITETQQYEEMPTDVEFYTFFFFYAFCNLHALYVSDPDFEPDLIPIQVS
jgi:hypothetical protein